MPRRVRRVRHTTSSPGQPGRRSPKRVIDPLVLAQLLRRRKAAGFVIALLIIIALVTLDRTAGLLPVDDDWHRYHEQSFEVVRVIDGDTIDLRVPDGDKSTTRVRLWGVDTPEMARGNDGESAEPWAQEATDFTKAAAQGQRVTLILQEHRLRGGFGRLLAYVVLPDGRVLNAELIKNGLSPHDDRWGHDRAEAYADLEQEARQSRRGIWSD